MLPGEKWANQFNVISLPIEMCASVCGGMCHCRWVCVYSPRSTRALSQPPPAEVSDETRVFSIVVHKVAETVCVRAREMHLTQRHPYRPNLTWRAFVSKTLIWLSAVFGSVSLGDDERPRRMMRWYSPFPLFFSCSLSQSHSIYLIYFLARILLANQPNAAQQNVSTAAVAFT